MVSKRTLALVMIAWTLFVRLLPSAASEFVRLDYPTLGVIDILRTVLGVWILYELWRLAAGRKGEVLLLWAWIAQFVFLGVALYSLVRAQLGWHWAPTAAFWPFSILWFLDLVVAGLFAAGLLRTRLVPTWIPWLWVAAVFLFPAFDVAWRFGLHWPHQVSLPLIWFTRVLSTLFWLCMAGALLLQSRVSAAPDGVATQPG